MSTYRVSTYDPADDPDEDGAWTVQLSGVGSWDLREAILELRSRGYSDDLSILVEREVVRGAVDATTGIPGAQRPISGASP